MTLKIVIAGPAGAGKSTLLDVIADALQQRNIQYRYHDDEIGRASTRRLCDVDLAGNSLCTRTAGFGNEIVLVTVQTKV